MKQNKSN